jgi:hypothetical protein
MGKEDCTLHRLLLSYVGLLAERHAFAPGDAFEYQLWDDIKRKKPTLVSKSEQKELVALSIRTDAWVTYNVDTRMFELVEMDAWCDMLRHRDH